MLLFGKCLNSSHFITCSRIWTVFTVASMKITVFLLINTHGALHFFPKKYVWINIIWYRLNLMHKGPIGAFCVRFDLYQISNGWYKNVSVAEKVRGAFIREGATIRENTAEFQLYLQTNGIYCACKYCKDREKRTGRKCQRTSCMLLRRLLASQSIFPSCGLLSPAAAWICKGPQRCPPKMPPLEKML